MSWLLRFYSSTVGMKIVMAITGALLFGFLGVHMVGNLQVFLGEEELNAYGAALHKFVEVLWLARTVLLTALVAHVVSMVRLFQLSKRARPVAYQKREYTSASPASRAMYVTGPIVLAFIIFHLLHFTVGSVHPDFQMQHEEGVHAPAVFHNVTTGFKVLPVVLFYVVSQLGLGFHLYHGGVSMFRSLGLSGERQEGLAKMLARMVTFAIIGGNIIIPIAVYLGIYPH